ncbi:MAG: Alcohol dehydrogenase YqhD [Chloroflexi bacterium ADurb.Bin120]|jgi:NADP-dependent alcohol dehydrogenase|uniref:Alcohol dehydrogenase, NAD(P)-dependent n=1 Tax=Candidatus Brevifilum fermentans TaxID=1986204 RepID=A0A1Y6K0F6_9CHLR|nr:iron-containing alcohol dehydrogenase [Brevefilum fermentans]MDI9565210.1 iron-containing alcohol dehydrogenase [Chloroflexota bacterium]OQB87004.1 MAG: Alcohol dehydrogenase YqhD [Chloroflexi bacterium ADurb.Bin120]SMX53121.1 alcohol dehydrogenase, NAD(P)-dependent [Brevefilum fermentans]HOM67417.1 iron-containing alcohol dehydrogenase [Brevefilum fermentans]
MNNFEYFNPTRIVFGKGQISRLRDLVPQSASVLMCYGGGSIKHNGVYEQVLTALAGWELIEFSGIEPNPDFDTLMHAIRLGREKGINFVLAVGGGSVIDGAKLIAAGIPYQQGDVWDIVTMDAKLKRGDALPLGTVLTLPATASEMNGTSVISRRSTQEKLGWFSEAVFPVFSILDPTTTFTLPIKQVRNGVVDAYIHVIEQYATYPVNALLQDRQAEGILITLQTVGEDALKQPPDYDTRANFMWAATSALNKLINKGVPEDWATHRIGHELTAFYGLDHAESLAVVLPYLLWHQRQQKADKLVQYAQRVWGLHGDGEAVIRAAIDKMTLFFNRLGMPTKLTDFNINPDEAAERVRARFESRQVLLGELNQIDPDIVAEILRMSQ